MEQGLGHFFFNSSIVVLISSMIPISSSISLSTVPSCTVHAASLLHWQQLVLEVLQFCNGQQYTLQCL